MESFFSEKNGVDLIKVINAIKMRPTHSNIIFPGPGIGAIAFQKMEVWVTGLISIFWALRMEMRSSRSPPQQLI